MSADGEDWYELRRAIESLPHADLCCAACLLAYVTAIAVGPTEPAISWGAAL